MGAGASFSGLGRHRYALIEELGNSGFSPRTSSLLVDVVETELGSLIAGTPEVKTLKEQEVTAEKEAEAEAQAELAAAMRSRNLDQLQAAIDMAVKHGINVADAKSIQAPG